jgi:GDP-L-fucose synthase
MEKHMNKNSKIYIAGHRGMVGSALLRKLNKEGYSNIICRTSKELDLTRQDQVESFFIKEKPEYVFLAAAKVGGIYANNKYPAEFIYNNLMIQSNIIHSSYKNKVKKLLFLGSSCIYPKYSEQPIKEEFLLTGTLEKTNEAYAIAKISGIELCKFYRRQYGCNFISVMPTNLYGINDNFDLKNSHVLPALIRKTHEAKENQMDFIEVWGSGKPKREFLYVDDLADACLYLMKKYNNEEHINVGTGKDISIEELVEIIKKVVGFKGDIKLDLSKPDGTPRKLLDVNLIHSTGWRHQTELYEGIQKVYNWYKKNIHLKE